MALCCPETLHCNCVQAPIEYRVYCDLRATKFALVDEDDYQWAVQWLWSWKKSRASRKLYVRRTMTLRGRAGSKTVYLHIEIMERMGLEKPSPLHTIVGHKDGNSLNCRRANLQWETSKTNYVDNNMPRDHKGKYVKSQSA